jgi:hypothetical protein
VHIGQGEVRVLEFERSKEGIPIKFIEGLRDSRQLDMSNALGSMAISPTCSRTSIPFFAS